MTATAAPAAPGLFAALWMAGAIASFATMALGGRALSAELDTFEIMAFRSLIGLPAVTALLLWQHGRAGFATARPGAHAFRHSLHFAAQNCWFYGVATIPLAQLVAIEFTNPIWVALLAPLLLAERLTRGRLLAVGLGFLGILIVARPGVAPLGPGHAAALAAAIGFAVTNICTKRLAATDATLTIVFWMTASQAALGLLSSAPGGIAMPSAALMPWMLLVGVCGLTAHFSLTQALSLAPASVVAPMEFLRLPVVAVAAALLYGEPLEVAVFAGAALILLGNLLNLRKERA